MDDKRRASLTAAADQITAAARARDTKALDAVVAELYARDPDAAEAITVVGLERMTGLRSGGAR